MNAQVQRFGRITHGELQNVLVDWLEERLTRSGMRPLDDLRERIRFDDTRDRYHAVEDRHGLRNVSVIVSDQYPFPFAAQDFKTGLICSGKLYDPAYLPEDEAHDFLVKIGRRQPQGSPTAPAADPEQLAGEQRQRAAQRQQWAAEQRRRMEREDRKHRRGQADAHAILSTALPGISHYLAGKGLPDANLKTDEWLKRINGPQGWTRHHLTGAAIITMHDESGEVWNLQALFDAPQSLLDGRNKDFLPGRKSGLHHRIDGPNPAALLICEGYATGLSLKLMTQCPVLVAFDAGNLALVARAARHHQPQARIIVAGDDDRGKAAQPGRDANVGRVAAHRAARDIQAEVLLPDFSPGDPGTDWDDWRRLYWEGDVWAL